jgi:arylsulfatase A-like enzyme
VSSPLTRKALRVLALVGPRPLVGVLILVAVAVETCLLATCPDSPLRSGASHAFVIVPCLAWWWTSVAWILRVLIDRVSRATASWPTTLRVAVRTVALGLLVVAAVFYAMSWSLYLRLGFFASSEIFDWFVTTSAGSDTNIRAIFASELRDALAFLLVAGLLVPSLAVALARSAPLGEGASFRRGRRLAWFLLTALTAIAVAVSLRSSSARPARADLRYRLNPVLTLAATALDRDDGIGGATLDTGELHVIEPLPDMPTVPTPGPVIFIKVESLRNDVVESRLREGGAPIMPHLGALSRDGLRFTRTYAPSTHTDLSDVSILSSTYPLRERTLHDYRSTDPWPIANVYDVLKRGGYATAMFSSQSLSWRGMIYALRTPGLDVLHDSESGDLPTHTYPWDGSQREVDDRLTTSDALEWVHAQVAARKPFFLSLQLQTSHFPYRLPEGAAEPFQPSTYDFPARFFAYPDDRTHVFANRYFNALREVDAQIERVRAALDELGVLREATIVVYGDHGEMFHEQPGYVTHSREPFEPVARVPLIVYSPSRIAHGRDDYPAELIDCVPTILGMLGVPRYHGFQGLDLLQRDRPPRERRAIFIHVNNPLAHSDAVIVAGRWKLIRDEIWHRCWLFDLEADPQERRNLARSDPDRTERLTHLLERWRSRQVAYYSNESYYKRFFPPEAPRADDR